MRKKVDLHDLLKNHNLIRFYRLNGDFLGEMETIMGYTDEQKKELYFANTVIGAIDNIETPMLMYEGEKNVVKKALQMYIDKLEMESYDK